MVKFTPPSFPVILLVALLTLTASETEAQVTYDMALGYRRALSPDFIGYNGANVIRDSIGWNNPLLIGNLPKLNPKNLRYPAGGTANWWDWHTGWFVNRTDLPSGYTGLNPKPSKLEAFKISMDSTGSNAILVLNMLSSNLQDQLAMLRHADSIGVPVQYVELGSEFYLDGGEDSVAIVTMYPTAESYADTASRWADSIHYYFPNAKCGMQGAFNRNNAERRDTWDETSFPYMHGEDAITYHTYMSVDDYDDTATISTTFYPSDVPVMMGRPFKMWTIMQTEDLPLVPPGKEIWITEYNMRDHSKPVQGCWGQALFVTTQTLQFLNDSRITHTMCHAMSGSAVAGAYFNTVNGYNFGADGNFTPPPVWPGNTQYWGLSSTGFGMKQLGLLFKDAAYASPLEFKYIHNETAYDGLDTLHYPGLYGWAVISDSGTQVYVVNLTDSNMSINTSYLFPSGGMYSTYYADPMLYVTKDADVTKLEGASLPTTLSLHPYSLSRISGSDIPAAPPAVSITAQGVTSFCLGDSVQLDAGSGYTEYRWSTGDSTQTIWAKKDGDYWIHARTLTNGYWGGDTLHVTVHQPPVIPVLINMPSHSFCHGDSLIATVKFPDSTLTYVWSNGGQGASTAVKSGCDLTVTATDSNGCHSTSVPVTFTEMPLPTPTITALGPTEFCYYQSVTLEVTSAYTSYNWSNGDHGQDESISETGTFSCTVTDSNGCKAPSNSISTIRHDVPVPDVYTSTGDTTFCSNSGLFISTSTTGFSWQWQLGGNNIDGATNQDYYPMADGNYRMQITDSFGCTNRSNAITLDMWVAPNPNILGSTSLCSGQTSATLSTNIPYAAYLWSTGDTSSVITVSDGGTYSLTVTDTNGCSNTTPSSKTVTAYTPPVPEITSNGEPLEFCSGNSVLLSVEGSYSNYSWSSGGHASTKTINNSGTYYCTVTDSHGCTGQSNSLVVDEHILPVPDIDNSNGTSKLCIDSNYLSTSLIGYSYQWQNGGDDIIGATDQIYYPTKLGNTTKYRVVITDALGCTARSDSYQPNVVSLPSFTITGAGTICSGVAETLGTSHSYGDYRWSTGDSSATISVSTGGVYSVTVTDANNCSATAYQTMGTGTIPTPEITSNGEPTEFCNGGSVTLSVTGNYASYSWSNGGTNQDKDMKSSGDYYCTVTDSVGCMGQSNTISVNEHILPVPVLTDAGPLTACADVGAMVGTTTTGYAYQWFKGNATISGATDATYTASKTSNYKVQISDSFGCTNKSSLVSVTINPTPDPSIPGNGLMCDGSTIELAPTQSFSSYLWSTGDTSQSITVDAAGDYTLTVTNTYGCSGSTTKSVTYDSIATPVITPSGPVDICGGSVVLSTTDTFHRYSWSNGKTKQSVTIANTGTYSCTVTDEAGCTSTSDPVTVTVHSVPVPDIYSSDGTTFCSNSGVYIGTHQTGYYYSWFKGSAVMSGATDQTYTPTQGGTYKVQISDDFGCTNKSSGLKLTVYAAPAPYITGDLDFCEGSSTTLSSNVSFTSYLWSNGATTKTTTVDNSDSYTITVTNSKNCTATSAPVNTTAFPLPDATITYSTPLDFCNGGSVDLSAPSSSSYLWSTGKTKQTVTISGTGDYTVTVTDANGCENTSDQVHVEEHNIPDPTISLSIGPATYCLSSPSTLTADLTGYFYQWAKGSDTIGGATNQTYQPTKSGIYKVTISDSLGCSNTSNDGFSVSVLDCRLEDEMLPQASSIALYPNPANDHLHVDVTFGGNEAGEAVLEIYNALGELAYREEQDITKGHFETEIRFDGRFESGAYFARVTLGNNQLTRQFLITTTRY